MQVTSDRRQEHKNTRAQAGGAYWCTSALVLWCTAALAAPLVSNVWFAQRTNSNLVDVWYDLAYSGSAEALAVSLAFSTDGGSTFSIVPRTVSGDIGPGQKTGTRKHVIWDAGKDYPTLAGENVFARVTADDGIAAPPRPAGDKRQETSDKGTGDKQQVTSDGQQATGDRRHVTSGMEFLRTNDKGYEEYLWLRDSSVIIRIPSGTFEMGSDDGEDDEKPVHRVFLTEYYIDKCEVTNLQYARFCEATGRKLPPSPPFTGLPNYVLTCPTYPVVNITWDDVEAYCNWSGKRAPTEAEWERAARGQDGRKYPWGSCAPKSAPTGNFADSRLGRIHSDWDLVPDYDDGHAFPSPVGSFPAGASPCGCVDMAGNVWEWCRDWYDPAYYRTAEAESSDPVADNVPSADYRVKRGGSWHEPLSFQTCSNRSSFMPGYGDYDLGFRTALSMQDKSSGSIKQKGWSIEGQVR